MEATPFRKTVGTVAIIEDHQSIKVMFVMGMLPDELIQVRILSDLVANPRKNLTYIGTLVFQIAEA